MCKHFFSRFSSVLSRCSSVLSPPLGRWCLKDTSTTYWKIDMANMDHCGTCANEKAKSIPTIYSNKSYDTMK